MLIQNNNNNKTCLRSAHTVASYLLVLIITTPTKSNQLVNITIYFLFFFLQFLHCQFLFFFIFNRGSLCPFCLKRESVDDAHSLFFYFCSCSFLSSKQIKNERELSFISALTKTKIFFELIHKKKEKITVYIPTDAGRLSISTDFRNKRKHKL